MLQMLVTLSNWTQRCDMKSMKLNEKGMKNVHRGKNINQIFRKFSTNWTKIKSKIKLNEKGRELVSI